MIELHENWFHLCDSKISYIISLMENRQPAQTYFGPFLSDVDDEGVACMNQRLQKAAGTVKYSAGSSFTLADQTSELPVYGTTSFQTGMIELAGENGGPLYPDFKITSADTLKGKTYPFQGPHCWPDPEAETLRLTLYDDVLQIEARLFYTIYPDQAVLVKNMEVKNNSAQIRLLKKAASAVFYLMDADWDFVHLAGNWARERQIVSQPLQTGGIFTQSLYGSSSHQCNPYMAFVKRQASHTEKEAYGCNLVYSSNFLNQAEVSEFGFVRVMSGIHPQNFLWQLDDKETFQSPEAVLAYSPEGLDGLSRV